MKEIQLMVTKIKQLAIKIDKNQLNLKTEKKFQKDENKTTKLEKYNIRN